MLHVELDRDNRIVLLQPSGALEQSDFEAAAKLVDPFIEQVGMLSGVIIYVENFPGWDSFAALSSHLKFVKEHHRYVRRVAFVTDSSIADIAEKVASHFVAAQVKHFPFSELDRAKLWILDP